MKAIVFDGELRLDKNYPDPFVSEGEVLVRVRRAGICNTDLEIIRGYQGFKGIIGHEFVGELADGRRVAGEINASDGTCPACRRGDNTHCEERSVLGIAKRDGAFAEHLTLPQVNLHLVPDTVSDNQATFIEPIAAALEILQQIHFKPTSRVAIIGDGKLGIICAQVMALTGIDLTAIGHHEHKLDLLKRRGISTTLQPERLQRDFDIIVECTGNPSGFDLAQRLLRPRGVLVLKSTFHGRQDATLSPLVVDEITMVGSRCGPFAPAIRLLEKKLIDVEALIEAEYFLDDGLAAIAHAQRKGSLKVVLVMPNH